MKFQKSRQWTIGAAMQTAVLGGMMSLAFRFAFVWMGLDGYGEAEQQLLANKGIGVLIVELLVLSPILEELLFRGVLYRFLKEHVSMRAAMLLSSILFGVYHWNLPQGIYAFVMGLMLVDAMERYSAIKAPMIMHMAANLAALMACAVTGAI